MSRDQDPPLIQVVRGHPRPEEIAALTIVLSSLRRPVGAVGPAPQNTDGWAARWRGLRTRLRPGPDAWRMSARGFRRSLRGNGPADGPTDGRARR